MQLLKKISLGILALSISSLPTSAMMPKAKDQIQEFEDLIARSEQFALKHAFPTVYNLAKNIGNSVERQSQIVKKMQDTYPIAHARVIRLVEDFLELKRVHEIYQNETTHSFVDRLLKKRPLTFLNSNDHYRNRDGQRGSNGFIDKEGKNGLLNAAEYISYEEMAISALIGVSVPSFMINNGKRNNLGVVGDVGSFEEEGIIIGQVGARFEAPGKMEYAHMMVQKDFNTGERGYGLKEKIAEFPLLKIWEKFYGLQFATFEEAQEEAQINDSKCRFIKVWENTYLDSYVYKERMKLVIEPFLLDANDRALKANKKAYVHVVGLGLGVWSVSKHQEQLQIDAYAEILRKHELSNIADINFSWFKEGLTCGQKGEDKFIDKINIIFSRRNPADKLVDQDEGKLLVVQYAWDSNAYPGNEYWEGLLSASGDPAAACFSMIAELQNPEINPDNVNGFKLKTY